MPGIDAFADRLSSYLGPDQVNLVRRAYYYAEQAHDGQRRRSGEPYVTHPLAVSNILADMHMDHQSLMAAMLHDVIDRHRQGSAHRAVRRDGFGTGRRGQQADPDELRDQGRGPGRELPDGKTTSRPSSPCARSLPAWSMRTSSSRKTSSRTNRCSQRSTTRPTPRPCKPWPRLDVACERRNPPTGRG